jgi:hypothetical protein
MIYDEDETKKFIEKKKADISTSSVSQNSQVTTTKNPS